MKFRCLCLLEQIRGDFCTKLLEKCIDCLWLMKYSLLFSCEIFMLRSTSSFRFSRDDFAFFCTVHIIRLIRSVDVVLPPFAFCIELSLVFVSLPQLTLTLVGLKQQSSTRLNGVCLNCTCIDTHQQN